MKFLKSLINCLFWLLILALMAAPLGLIWMISQQEMAQYVAPEAPVLQEVSIGTPVSATRQDVAECITVNGQFTSIAWAYQELEQRKPDQIRWLVNVGDEIQAGQVIGTYNGENVIAEHIQDHPVFFREFFLHRTHIYYLRNNELYRMNRFSGAYEPYMDLPNVANLSYDGQNIYYTDHYNQLVIRSLDSGEEKVIDQVVANDFLLTPEGIYFVNLRDHNTLYHWDPVSGAVTKRNDIPANEVYWDSDYLWIEGEGATIYRMDHNGDHVTHVPYEGYVCCIPEGDTLYLRNITTWDICEVNKNTLDISLLEIP